MSTGSPTPQGPFRTLCALGGLCARVFAQTDWLHGSRRVAEIAEDNKPKGAGFPLKTAKEPCLAVL
jgi:hypothetical protein